MTSTAFTSRSRMPGLRWTVPAAVPSSRAAWAGAREWCATSSREGSVRRRAGSTRTMAGTLGVLVQCNYGRRRYLRIAGAPVGQEIADLVPCRVPCSGARSGMAPAIPPDVGSIIIVVATDAPLLPHQLRRIARRAALGVGRLGGVA